MRSESLPAPSTDRESQKDMRKRRGHHRNDNFPHRLGGLALFAAALGTQSLCAGAEITLKLDPTCTSCDVGHQVGRVQSRTHSEPHPTIGLPDGAPCLFGDPAGQLSMAEAVERALCHDPRVREIWAQVRAQRAIVGIERASLLPDLGAEAGVIETRERLSAVGNSGRQSSHKRGLDSSVHFSWLLYDFGSRAATVEKARQLLASVEATRDARLQTVLLDTAQRFYGTLGAQAALDLRAQALHVALDSQKVAEARFRSGIGTRLDVLQAKTAASQAAVARAKAEGELRGAMGALALGVGLKVNTPLKLEAPQFNGAGAQDTKTVDELIGAAYEQNPSLKAVRAQLVSARQNVAVEKAEGLPSLSFRASLTRNTLRATSEAINAPSSSSVQFAISIPLYEGNIRSYRVQNALAQVDARAAELKASEEQVALDTWQAYQAVRTETDNMKASEALASDARQAFDIARGRYRAGIGPMQDVLTAQVALAEAEQLKIQSVMQWRVARLKMAAALGNLGRDADY